MAGFLIASITGLLPFVVGRFRLGRSWVVLAVGGVLAFGWLVALAAKPVGTNAVPLWYVSGMVILLYGIWCGGLWLGVRLRRIRRASPG
jgi:hypothetical protein